MNSLDLFEILVSFYLDPRCFTVYAGRWDVWCIQNNNWYAYRMLMMKSDGQLKQLLERARERAKEISESPLGKALS